MKAILLAAGRGKRMRPLSDHTPKPLLKIGPHALIEHHLYALARAGIQSVVINIAHLKAQFKPILGNGEKYGLEITYSIEPAGGLETGGGIVNALPLLGHSPFIVVNSDIWTDYPFDKLSQKLNTNAHIVLTDNPPHNPAGDFALKNGYLSNIGNKLTYCGIGIFSQKFFEGCNEKKFSLTSLLTAGAESGNSISAEHYQGEWQDIGTPERLEALNRQHLTKVES